MYYRHHYESLGAFIQASKRPALASANSSKRTGRDEDEFSGTPTFEKALDLVEHGWPEGRKNIMAAMSAAQASPTFTRILSMDVGGSYPIPALAAAGDPCSMVALDAVEDRVRPIVRLVVQRAGSAAYSVEAFTNYGAAVLSYVEGLEGAGFRCEIVVAFCSDFGTDGDQLITVTVKRAEEPIEPDRMAYVMTHPSMFRRICFSVYESTEGLANLLNRHAYGYSRNPKAEEVEPGQIIVPGINNLKPSDPALRTPQACIEKIGPMIEAQLKQAGVDPPAQAFGGKSSK